jgi:stage V sporulation protein R
MEDKEIKELERALEQIWEIARRFGLDPFPTRFEIVPATVMYEIGSYALPGRYSHWTFGKAYHKMKMMYDFGLSKIYEVVINTNPSYGFLLETNSPLQNKLVMAHVLGHVDFFKHNVYFSKTNRRMVESVSQHAARMNEYEFKYGRKTVEKFLDAVLSIEEHIDPNFFIRRESKRKKDEPRQKPEGRYDDLLGKVETEPQENPSDEPQPEKDLLYYIMRNSPTLEDWQRDVMAMIHDEMEYFVPQMQTKIMNEGWACATGDSLLPTVKGFIRFDELYSEGEKTNVAAGVQGSFPITDFHKEQLVPTIRLRTRRGLTIEGALKHRVQLVDGTWIFLRDIKTGARVRLACGANVWAREKFKINFAATKPSATLHGASALAGVSLSTVIRHLKGRRTLNAFSIEEALQKVECRTGWRGKAIASRKSLRVAEELNQDLAQLLGSFIGDGNKTKSGVCFTCGEEVYADEIMSLVNRAIGLNARKHWDATKHGGRWRVVVHSRELLRLLEWLGVDLTAKAPQKQIPRAVLRSPKDIISAFLRGYFDANAYVGKHGIILSSASDELINATQIILLNYGILSRQRAKRDGCTQLEIKGASAEIFAREINFGLPRKQAALRDYVEKRRWFKKEDETDEVVEIAPGCADVYDITVDTAHAYVANGFINHNSFWHARIMRELDLSDKELLEFAELHSGVVSPHKGQLNPYYLGYKIFEDIERRWDNPTEEERKRFGRKGGEGRAKIFEVRELDNDVSFLRNYLTEELCEELDLFVYELVDEEEWTVTEKRWERVRDQLVANMTNFGFPYIVALDGDYNHNRELYLKHLYEGAELDMQYARKTLEYVYQLWGRPVHLETTVDGESVVMHYDGNEHDEN